MSSHEKKSLADQRIPLQVDGDGKADLIWVDKFDSKGRLWTNGGFTPAAGSSMTWDYQGFRFDGHGRGQNIHFPKIGTSGHADYHVVWPDTAISDTYFNDCSRQGEGQDDYPEPFDPNLPTLPGGGVGTGDFPTDRLDYAKSEYQGIYWDVSQAVLRNVGRPLCGFELTGDPARDQRMYRG